MSANFYDRMKPHEPPQQRPRTLDLDTTTDVHEEHTADLEPATADVDFVPGQPPRPTLAEAPPQRARAEPPRPAPSAAGESEPTPIRAESLFAHPGLRPERVDRASTSSSTKPELIGAGQGARREPYISTPAPIVAAPAATITVDVPMQEAPAPAVASITAAHRPVALKPVEAVAQRAPQGLVLTPGKVLCDRYLLEQVIGCGGTAIVFRARDMLSATGAAPNRQVAIKAPRPELGDVARATKRLKHEFDHAKLLSHPSIVRVLDLHEDDGRPFMTMELVEGRLLSGLLRDWTMLPVSLAYKLLRQCAEALHYAHSQNVVHGDFKPGNVFVTPDEGVRIVDFGTAAGPSTNDSRIPAGTPTYASPEVLNGATPDRRDDVFSFACVAYEVLTGQHPFGRLSSVQARDEGKIPPRAWNLSTTQWLSLLSALSWKREQRPTDVEELLTRLNPEQPITAAPTPVHVDPEEVVPAELPADLMPKQRSWGFFAFIACAALVTYLAYQRQNAPHPPATPAAIAPAAATAPPAPAPVVEPATASTSTPTEAAATAETKPEATPAALLPAAAAKPAARPAAPISEISFESSTIVTSESSVAGVFLIKRSQPLSGRVSVSWKAVSGTADAGIDFASNASGTVTFADGQAQRAIYVPLRNDLLKEDGDESFYVELLAPKAARLGQLARAEAVIRDDD